METIYKLNIENPCQKKKWSDMTPSDKARFCSQCNKNVFDFVNWTDEEIIRFLNRQDEKICARLSYAQINRIIAVKEKSKIHNWHKIVAGILLVASVNVSAQEKHIETSQQFQHYESEISHTKITVKNDSIKNRITGKLVEEDSREPIPNVIVGIKGTVIIAKTDSLGNFEILVPENYPNNEITLILPNVGYGFEGETEKTVYKNELPITNLIIEKPSVQIGEIIYYKPKKWWQFWKRR